MVIYGDLGIVNNNNNENNTWISAVGPQRTEEVTRGLIRTY